MGLSQTAAAAARAKPLAAHDAMAGAGGTASATTPRSMPILAASGEARPAENLVARSEANTMSAPAMAVANSTSGGGVSIE